VSKVVGTLICLAIFAALPSVAFGGSRGPAPRGDTVSSGNTQSGDIDQSASAGSGGNAGNQAAIVQQNAGRDANAAVNQQQNFSTGGANVHGRGGDHFRGHGGDINGHGHGGVSSFGVGGGGGVGGVSLARTGFEAWILALIGGAALAGGVGMLALRRRGVLSA